MEAELLQAAAKRNMGGSGDWNEIGWSFSYGIGLNTNEIKPDPNACDPDKKCENDQCKIDSKKACARSASDENCKDFEICGEEAPPVGEPTCT